MLWLTGPTSSGSSLRFEIDCLAVPQEFITKFLVKFKDNHPKDDIKAHNTLAKDWLVFLREKGILQLKGPPVTSCSAHFHTRQAFSMWGGILRGVDLHVGWRFYVG